MTSNMFSRFKLNPRALIFTLLLVLFNTLSFAAINYSSSLFPSNDINSLFFPGFKDAKDRSQDSVWGSVGYKNLSDNVSLNVSIPYDDCYVLENTYSKESVLTFLRLDGNKLINPCQIRISEELVNYPVVAVCLDGYFDIDYDAHFSEFTAPNKVIIPRSLADALDLDSSAEKDLDVVSKRYQETTQKRMAVSGVYIENEKTAFLRNFSGVSPIIISRNTAIPGIPVFGFRVPTKSYLYYSHYVERVFDSIVIERYAKEGNYAAKEISFYSADFAQQRDEINSIVLSRRDFIIGDKRLVALLASSAAFLFFFAGAQILVFRGKKRLSKMSFLCAVSCSVLFPLLLFSIVHLLTDVSVFPGHFQLLSGVGILLYFVINALFLAVAFLLQKKGDHKSA